MKTCESYEMHISALFDDEVERQDVIEILEHLPVCDSCQRFFRGAYQLQEIVDSQPLAGEAIEQFEASAAAERLPALHSGRATSTPHGSKRKVLQFNATPRWAWGVAAVLLLALAFWVRSDVTLRHPGASAASGRASITIHPNTSNMNDERFLEMAVELLESDPRYQTEMLGILMRFERARVVEEGTTALATSYGESRMFWDLGVEDRDEELEAENGLQLGIY